MNSQLNIKSERLIVEIMLSIVAISGNPMGLMNVLSIKRTQKY